MDFEFVLQDLTSSENLFWAWEKVRRQLKSDSAWCNQLELAAFEINLGQHLDEIGSEFLEGRYQTGALKPLGQPKKKRGSETGELEMRQMFWVPVRDQVAWVALVNIIGPALDSQMPQWSFGNRLHRSAWIEDGADQKRHLKIGPYRRSSPLFYRKFSQSWPLYKRYVYLTLRAMVSEKNKKYFELEEVEAEILKLDKTLPENLQCPYLQPGYWKKNNRAVYWATIDFEKFYPRLNIDHIQFGFLKHSPHAADPRFATIFHSLLQFHIDSSGCTEADLAAIDLLPNAKSFKSLPTGLVTAGFLANLAMLGVDKRVSEENKKFGVAHFRYVDDHTVLGPSLDAVVDWINQYQKILGDEGELASVNLEKVEPKALVPLVDLSSSLSGLDFKVNAVAEKEAKIDLQYPRPFLTKTLSRVSQLAKLEFELLDEQEQVATINDLELLLLADIGDSELPHATRLSFAATLLTRFSARLEPLQTEIVKWERERARLINHIDRGSRSQTTERLGEQNMQMSNAKRRLKELDIAIAQALLFGQRDLNARLSKSYGLLIKVIHENPDKLRLWERAIDFCLNTGYPGVRALFDEVRRLGSKNRLIQNYISAFLSDRLAMRILGGIKRIEFNQEDISDKQIKCWLNFVAECRRQRKKMTSSTVAAPIGQQAYDALSCALIVADIFFSKRKLLGEPIAKEKNINIDSQSMLLECISNSESDLPI